MGSKNAGANKADAANKQVQKQQNAIQAKEAKEVRSTPFGRSLGVGLGDTSKYSGALKDAIAKSNFKNSVLGKNPSLNQLADPLGRSGLPGEYGVTPGGVQDDISGTLGGKEISDLGAMIDAGKVAGIGGFDPLKPTSFQGFSSLNEQAAANELFGFNPTKNMSFLNSAKYQFTNPEFKRDVQRLGNLAKGIGTLSPVQNVFRSMLGMGPVKMNPIDPYNIGPKFASYDRFNPYSDEELEGMTNPAIYDRLFNNVSPVETGMFSNIRPMMRPDIKSVGETTNAPFPGADDIPDIFPDNDGKPTYTIDAIQEELRNNKFRNYVEDAYNPNLPNQFFDDSLDTEYNYDIRDYFKDIAPQVLMEEGPVTINTFPNDDLILNDDGTYTTFGEQRFDDLFPNSRPEELFNTPVLEGDTNSNMPVLENNPYKGTPSNFNFRPPINFDI